MDETYAPHPVHIKFEIERQHKTIGGIAEAIGYSRETVSKAINGERISWEIANAIAEELGVPFRIVAKAIPPKAVSA